MNQSSTSYSALLASFPLSQSSSSSASSSSTHQAAASSFRSPALSAEPQTSTQAAKACSKPASACLSQSHLQSSLNQKKASVVEAVLTTANQSSTSYLNLLASFPSFTSQIASSAAANLSMNTSMSTSTATATLKSFAEPQVSQAPRANGVRCSLCSWFA